MSLGSHGAWVTTVRRSNVCRHAISHKAEQSFRRTGRKKQENKRKGVTWQEQEWKQREMEREPDSQNTISHKQLRLLNYNVNTHTHTTSNKHTPAPALSFHAVPQCPFVIDACSDTLNIQLNLCVLYPISLLYFLSPASWKCQ